MKTDYQQYIAKGKYARWIDDLNRRETWEETVGRYTNFFRESIPTLQQDDVDIDLDFDNCERAILNLEVMPSMRALMTAGKALERDHVAGYNCSYVPIDHPRSFDETMYILLCGTGVGFSVERQFINRLPEVNEDFTKTPTIVVVADSKIGWATATREIIGLLYQGRIPTWDLSRLRPAGARLKTFGGRASGPEPLDNLFKFLVQTFTKAEGRRLNSIECHDIICKIADSVVSGGVRRSACISLSNLTDDRMARAKVGQWWIDNPQRALANNSVAYTERPDFDSFFKELRNLHRSKSGERGIINRIAFQKKAGEIGRDVDHEYGANPCGEIILRPNQFCNLSEVVIRHDDTLATLKRKVELATILGTLQATLTDFRYIRKIWKRNTEEERLLGVSLTGIMDHRVLSGTDAERWLKELRKVAHDTNEKWAKKLGIAKAAAITCVKPSGTVSQLVDSSSGIHPRLFRNYIRTTIESKQDPIGQFLIEQGVPHNEDDRNYYLQWPMKSPKDSVVSEDRGAIEQLELWKTYQDCWCDHNPSQTIYYTDDEFLDVGAWVWKNFDSIGGLSFFPKTDHVYENAPYKEVTNEELDALVDGFPAINWDDFTGFECEDNTTGSQEYACAGGKCEL